MATLTRSITIDAPVDTVFAYALDIANLWVVDDVALLDVDVKPEGVGTSARMYSHFLGFHLEGSIDYTEVAPGERIVAQVHFFAESPMWTFTFEPADGGTKVTMVGEWHVSVPIVGKPLEGMMVKEHNPMAEQLLGNLKAKVEAQVAA